MAQPEPVRCHESFTGALLPWKGQPAREWGHLEGRGAGRWKEFRNQVLLATLETLNQALPAA